jgi:MoaA/NifB/PqqE/SkfB family radical SAM enzyme
MGGAMAGSAICFARPTADSLDVVTLTINNVCNLSCPHCYLQYTGETSLIDWANVLHVLKATFRHLCIVGKEPLANRASADLVRRLVLEATSAGRSVSLITNGLNLPFLDAETLTNLSWLDVSMDAGRLSYKAYRGGSYNKLSRGIEYALRHGLRDLRILHTVSSANVGVLRDMVNAAFDVDCRLVVISPFQATRASGEQSVAMIPPSKLLDALIDTGVAEDIRLRLVLDLGYLSHFGNTEVVESATRMFGERFINIGSDPIDRGIIRVTYDGLVLSPLESINTIDYSKFGRPLAQRSLDDWFQIIRGEAQHTSSQCH